MKLSGMSLEAKVCPGRYFEDPPPLLIPLEGPDL